MEIRFDAPRKITSWIVHCIRNTGSGLSNGGRGTTCYGNGSYDFTYIRVEYWNNGAWQLAKLLNSRNSANWVAEYTGNAKSQNWRFYFSGGGSSGSCQHPGDCAPHVAEIDIWTC